MLYFPQSRIELTVERPLVPGAVINAEGAALAGAFSGGAYGVQNTTGTNDVFAGVSINNPIQVLTAPFIEQLTVPADGVVQLSYTPIGGSMSVVDANTNAVLSLTATAAASALTANQYQADATNPAAIDLNTSNSGRVINVAYRYAPTVLQSMNLQGMVLPGGPAGAFLGQIGVITRGDVFTSEFDTSANWGAAVGVTLEANGLFGAATTLANAIKGAQLIQVPTVGSAYLGVFVNVPN